MLFRMLLITNGRETYDEWAETLFRERARRMLVAVVSCGAAVVRAHIAKLRDSGDEHKHCDHRGV